jgi:hypothetical protein
MRLTSNPMWRPSPFIQMSLKSIDILLVSVVDSANTLYAC